jgi:phosphoribosylformylglycinamidine synthase
LEHERRIGELIRELIAEGRVTAVHDVSDGGILVALAEMALASGIGANLETPVPLQNSMWAHPARAWFGEDQGRYIVTAEWGDVALYSYLQDRDVACEYLGDTGSSALNIYGCNGDELYWTVPLEALRRAHEGFFPALMGGEITVA